jgi:predicted transcriptional regulator
LSRILLSIKPEYVKLILDGSKKYEFRRRLAREPVDSIVIYSSSPQMAVVGEVEVIHSIAMSPSALWEFTKKEAGISRAKFRRYFKDCKKAYGYKLGNVTVYEPPKALEDLKVLKAPQSFIYLAE